jgi:hypothetical protein
MTFYGLKLLYLTQFTQKIAKSRRSAGNFGVGLRFGNKVIQKNIKNTPEDDLGTFCIIISHLTSKYCPDFFGTSKIAGPNYSDFEEHQFLLKVNKSKCSL